MKRTLLPLVPLLTLSVMAVAQPPTSRTYELTGRRFTEVPSTNPADLPRPDATLKRVETLLDRQDYQAARETALRWLLDHPADPNHDLGLYLMAQAVNGGDDPIRAFYYCDQLMDANPGSAYFRPALELQYKIGDGLMGGRGLKPVWFLPRLDGGDEGVEMMFRIQTRSPGSPLAERALRRTADYYFDDGQFDFAADAYASYIKSYPRSSDLPNALIRQAFSNYAQFTGVRFDPTPLVNARAQMQDLINKYPDEAERENMSGFVDAIDRTLARKLFVTADFYKRTGKPNAEKLTLRVLTQQYPQSNEAQQAKQILGEG